MNAISQSHTNDVLYCKQRLRTNLKNLEILNNDSGWFKTKHETENWYKPWFPVYYWTVLTLCHVSADLSLLVYVQHSLSRTVTLYAFYPSDDLPFLTLASAGQSIIRESD